MSYNDELNKMFGKTNYSETEFVEKCNKNKTIISRGHFCKILSGKEKAPQEKVSREIARQLNGDERILVLEGYLEKAPHEFIEFMNKMKEALVNIIEKICSEELDEEFVQQIKIKFINETWSELIISILDMDLDIKIPNNIKIGESKNIIELLSNEMIYFEVLDDSMESKIPKGSKLRVSIGEKYENGDILLVRINGLRMPRIIIFDGEEIIACPLNKKNPKYKCQRLKKGEYEILGKVKSVEIDV